MVGEIRLNLLDLGVFSCYLGDFKVIKNFFICVCLFFSPISVLSVNASPVIHNINVEL